MNTLAMVLCMQQSYNKATTSSKSTYISFTGKVSGLQLSQVIAGSLDPFIKGIEKIYSAK